MKILGKQPSREKCAESGWFATDYLLDEPIDKAFILSLRPLGSFVYLDDKGSAGKRLFQNCSSWEA